MTVFLKGYVYGQLCSFLKFKWSFSKLTTSIFLCSQQEGWWNVLVTAMAELESCLVLEYFFLHCLSLNGICSILISESRANGFVLVRRQRPRALGEQAAGHSAERKRSQQRANAGSVPHLSPVRRWSCPMNVTRIWGEERIVRSAVEVFEWWLGTRVWKLMNNTAQVAFNDFFRQRPSHNLTSRKVIFIFISV